MKYQMGWLLGMALVLATGSLVFSDDDFAPTGEAPIVAIYTDTTSEAVPAEPNSMLTEELCNEYEATLNATLSEEIQWHDVADITLVINNA